MISYLLDQTGILGKGHMSEAVRIGTLGLIPYRVFSMEELQQATNSFNPSNLIEDSARGQVQSSSRLMMISLSLLLISYYFFPSMSCTDVEFRACLTGINKKKKNTVLVSFFLL